MELTLISLAVHGSLFFLERSSARGKVDGLSSFVGQGGPAPGESLGSLFLDPYRLFVRFDHCHGRL